MNEFSEIFQIFLQHVNLRLEKFAAAQWKI
jgi:hypothetical protein